LFPEIKGKRSFSFQAPSARTEQDTPDGSEDGGDVYATQLTHSQWYLALIVA
jgi:hypothetical protein